MDKHFLWEDEQTFRDNYPIFKGLCNILPGSFSERFVFDAISQLQLADPKAFPEVRAPRQAIE